MIFRKYYDLIIVKIILRGWTALSLCGALAGMSSISPALTSYLIFETNISAMPSVIITRAS